MSMIFPKQLLNEQLELKFSKEFEGVHPFKTVYKDGEKSFYQLYIMNFHTFFDLKSNEMKNLMFNARKEINEKCFKEEHMDIYPNEKKIEQCIRNTELKYLGKHFNKRNVYFGNILQHLNDTLESLPSNDKTEGLEAVERLVWDSFKAKHFFKEKLFE